MNWSLQHLLLPQGHFSGGSSPCPSDFWGCTSLSNDFTCFYWLLISSVAFPLFFLCLYHCIVSPQEILSLDSIYKIGADGVPSLYRFIDPCLRCFFPGEGDLGLWCGGFEQSLLDRTYVSYTRNPIATSLREDCEYERHFGLRSDSGAYILYMLHIIYMYI